VPRGGVCGVLSEQPAVQLSEGAELQLDGVVEGCQRLLLSRLPRLVYLIGQAGVDALEGQPKAQRIMHARLSSFVTMKCVISAVRQYLGLHRRPHGKREDMLEDGSGSIHVPVVGHDDCCSISAE